MSKQPSEDRLTELAARVASRTGFDHQVLSPAELLRVLRRFMSEQRLEDGDACIAHLLKDETAFENFLQELVVPETWFFRDREPFYCLRRFIADRWRPQQATSRLRILSIPCSTGEEPYSIAMTVLDAGLSSEMFSVDAADISSRLLARARQARYGRSSFRGDEQPFSELCERYLERVEEDRYAPGRQLRECVRFVRGNLISPRLLIDQPGYHVIFCRNVLIYLHDGARGIALRNLGRLLLPEGLLYTGHVEARLVTDAAFHAFDSTYPSAFTPAKRDQQTSAADVPPVASGASRSPGTSPGRHRGVQDRGGAQSKQANSSSIPRSRRAQSQTSGEANVPQPEPACAATLESMMTAAQTAADTGQLESAERLCRKIVQSEPAHTEAWFLMALVALAGGATGESERILSRVLYLDPRHQKALVQMMLLAEKRGDARSAARFRRRVARASSQEGG